MEEFLPGENGQFLSHEALGTSENAPVPEIVRPPVPWYKKAAVDKSIWGTLIFITPLFFLSAFSQNAYPGDMLYPVKRTLETMVLALSSINPNTKASYTTSLADKRFQEAEHTLIAHSNLKTLSDFETELGAASTSITSVADPAEKQKLASAFVTNINTYIAHLDQLQTQMTEQGGIPSQSPPPQSTPSQQPAQMEQQVVQIVGKSGPTSTVQTPRQNSQPVVSPPPGPLQQLSPSGINEVTKIEEVKNQLEEIKQRMLSENTPAAASSPQPSVSPSPSASPMPRSFPFGNSSPFPSSPVSYPGTSSEHNPHGMPPGQARHNEE